MKIYANSNGELLRVLFTEDEERQYPNIPPDTAYSLDIDTDTNIQIVTALRGSVRWQDISLIADVLYYNGQPVTVNPPGETYQDRDFLRGWWTALNAAMDDLETMRGQTEQIETAWPGMTAQQKQAWLLDHFDEILHGLARVMQIVHGILRFVRWLIKGHFKLGGLE